MKSLPTIAAVLLALQRDPAAAAGLAGPWTTDGRAVRASGGRALRNTAASTLADTTLTIRGERERTDLLAYTADLERAELLR